MEHRSYIAIDLKSFYASVECMDRGLNPLTTNLVVADASRTEKTICLAVSPSLKAYGIPGRPRLFEVVQRVKAVNRGRMRQALGGVFSGTSSDDMAVKASPDLALGYITATPRMGLYMEYSTRIYQLYLKYVAPEDIHIYSIDEVFIDVTAYLQTYGLSPQELAVKIIQDVLSETGITATVGMGSNLYLCKIAMDIVAKHAAADENGARMAELDEMSYRRLLWCHRPLTDFWRVGKGYAKKLEENGLYTMGDVARCSLGGPHDYYNEDLLYALFGVNAELLIDHAWGWEPCTISDIKAYKPRNTSICSGQVLPCPYDFARTRLVVREMMDLVALDLVDKGLVTDQLVLTIGYDIENLMDPQRREAYTGPVTTDRYGRQVPKHAHGTTNLDRPTASSSRLTAAVMALFDRIVDADLLARRVTLTAGRLHEEKDAAEAKAYEPMDLFADEAAAQQQEQEEQRERSLQKAVLEIQKKFGKNAVLKGMNFEDGARTLERNKQIGGHKA